MKRVRSKPNASRHPARRAPRKPAPTVRFQLSPERGEKPKGNRRRYKVDRFPPDVRLTIYSGFINHEPYKKIRAAVKEQGYHITEQALSRFWRNCWFAEVDLLREARIYKDLICKALKLGDSTESGKIAEELLYTLAIKAHAAIGKRDPVALFREARDQEKVHGGKSAARSRTASGSPISSSPVSDEEMDQKIREIYGIPEPADLPEESLTPHAEESKS